MSALRPHRTYSLFRFLMDVSTATAFTCQLLLYIGILCGSPAIVLGSCRIGVPPAIIIVLIWTIEWLFFFPHGLESSWLDFRYPPKWIDFRYPFN